MKEKLSLFLCAKELEFTNCFLALRFGDQVKNWLKGLLKLKITKFLYL